MEAPIPEKQCAEPGGKSKKAQDLSGEIVRKLVRINRGVGDLISTIVDSPNSANDDDDSRMLHVIEMGSKVTSLSNVFGECLLQFNQLVSETRGARVIEKQASKLAQQAAVLRSVASKSACAHRKARDDWLARLTETLEEMRAYERSKAPLCHHQFFYDPDGQQILCSICGSTGPAQCNCYSDIL